MVWVGPLQVRRSAQFPFSAPVSAFSLLHRSNLTFYGHNAFLQRTFMYLLLHSPMNLFYMIPQSHSISKRSRWFFLEKAKQATLLSSPLNMQRYYANGGPL